MAEKLKLNAYNLISPRWTDDNIQEYLDIGINILDNDEDEAEDEAEDEETKFIFYNGNNELVKIFMEEKCCVCLEDDAIYAFRNCGHLSVCENCYKNTNITKCVICKS